MPMSVPTYNLGGFPWNRNNPVFHATVALSAVLREGFKARGDRGTNVVGGGSDKTISLTTDVRVAEAIALCLDTIRAIAQDRFNWAMLMEKFEFECPKAARAVQKDHEPLGIAPTYEVLERIDAGYWFLRAYGAQWPPEGFRQRGDSTEPPPTAIRDEERWGWWVPQSYLAQRNDPPDYNEALFRLYRWMLANGSTTKECYDPLFFSTDFEAFRKLRQEQIGVVAGRVLIDRVCTDPLGAYALGRITWEEAKLYERFLFGEEGRCRNALEYGDVSGKMYMYPFEMGRYHVDAEHGAATADNTMIFLAAMAELRVYNPRKVVIDRAISVNELREVKSYLRNRITYPYIDELGA